MRAPGPFVIITTPVGEQHGLVDIVRDHQHRIAQTLLDRHHGILQMRPGQRVERAERLVEQQHLRLHGERAGEADPLLHTP
jgi:hypothetical protein